jgi:hypothetical protein
MQIIKEYNKQQKQTEEKMAKTGYTGTTTDITQQQLLRELRKTRSDKGESRGPYKTRSKTEFRQDPTDAAAAEQAEIDRLVNLSIQAQAAQAAQAAQEQPVAQEQPAKRKPGRPKKERNPVGRPKKIVEEDTQGAKGAGFLSKYRNKPNKRVVKVSQEEKMKNRLRLVASQVKAGNDNPKIILELNALCEKLYNIPNAYNMI